MRAAVALALGAFALAVAAPAVRAAESELDLLRADLRWHKAQVLAAGLELNAVEAAAFWPIYREYEAEVSRIGDRRFDLLRDYGDSLPAMTDEKAAEIIRRSFALDEERLRLKARYFDLVAAATSARTAARFMQIEGQIEAVMYLQFTRNLPLFPRLGRPEGPEPLEPLPESK